MYVGFDVSKAWVDYALVNRAGKRVLFGSCTNTATAISELLRGIQQKHPGCRAIVESTGIYQQYVTAACCEVGVVCKLLNPIQTKQFTRSTVRKTKTDTKDAYHIALPGLQGAGYPVLELGTQLARARSYLRVADRLRDTATKLELMRQHMEEDLHGGDTSELAVCKQQLVASIAQYRELAAQQLTSGTDVVLLQSIPGIGSVLSLGIVAEIGMLERFHSAEQLVAYAGLDPRIAQSGHSHATGRLTKRGSPFLRRNLFLASSVAQRHDPELKAAYNKQRARGKSYTVATVATARKLTHRIYAVLRRQTPYVVRDA